MDPLDERASQIIDLAKKYERSVALAIIRELLQLTSMEGKQAGVDEARKAVSKIFAKGQS
jgi:hypothetical protein